MCSHDALFLCLARNTAQKERRRERERTQPSSKKKKSRRRRAMMQSKRGLHRAYERENSCVFTSIPIPNSQKLSNRREMGKKKALLLFSRTTYLVFLLQTLVALVQTVEDLLKHLLLLVHLPERLVDLRLELTNRRHDV